MQQVSRVMPLSDIEVLSRAKGGDGRTIVAYAAVFSEPTSINDQDGSYDEQIAPVAFNRTLAEGRAIPVFYNHARTVHGSPSELGSVPIGSPVEPPRPDGRGLLTTTRLNQTQLADQVLASIRNGDPMGMSFTGRFVRSAPARPRGGYAPDRSGARTLVTRTDIGLLEYGPTPTPAYPGAAVVGVRSGTDLCGPETRREYLERLDVRMAARRRRVTR